MDIVTKMRDELAALEKEIKITLPRVIREAAAHGDLSENAEYDAAKQRQEWVKGRIRDLQSRVAALSLVDLRRIPTDRAAFGSTVTLEDVNSGEEKVYRIVHPEEVDGAKGLISIQSPLGQAISSKQEGDEVTLALPGGAKVYVISRLVTIHQQAE